ncbi:MAG: DNA binding domain, excisionase family, partial [uncultured Corynebacteriales bacterium]
VCTTARRTLGTGQVLDRRRGRGTDAGVQDDRLPAGPLRGDDRGAGRPLVPGAGEGRPRLPAGRVHRGRL